MNAVPLALKRAIGVGIGLFILFIGFVNGGFIVTPAGRRAARRPRPSRRPPRQFVFLVGLAPHDRPVRPQDPGRADHQHPGHDDRRAHRSASPTIPADLALTPSFATLGRVRPRPRSSRTLGLLTAVLTIFAIMLTDFFDTMGTVTGIAAEAGLAERGRLRARASGGSCSSTASRRSPAASAASARTRPTSRARRASPRAAGPASPRSSPASCSCSRSSCRRIAGHHPDRGDGARPSSSSAT